MLIGLVAPVGQYFPAGEDRHFRVDGIERLARVVAPAVRETHPPVVFAFHGSGGKAYFAVDEYAIQKFWPQATVYYPQGLIDKNGYTTWSARDIAYFDALLRDAEQRYQVDPKQVFVLGYSSGANFASDLWETRGASIAGFALFSGGRYKKGWATRPVYFSYGLGESDAPSFSKLATKLENSLTIVAVARHPGGHAFPPGFGKYVCEFFQSGAHK